MQSLKVNNKITFRFLLIFALSTIYFSCNRKSFNSEEEFLTYLKEKPNGYIQHKNVNGYDFTLMYRPTDLLVKQELLNNIKDKSLKELRAKYKGYLYFNLSISKNNKELLSSVPKDLNEFSGLTRQLIFNMDGKVNLFNNKKDTIKIIDYVYPRPYGMNHSTTIMFIYPRDTEKLKTDYLNFSVEDFGLNTGEIKFKIDTKKIKEEPQLIF